MGQFPEVNKLQIDEKIELPRTTPRSINPLSKLDARNFQVRYFSPLWTINNTQFSYLGELDKWTTVSKQRVNSIKLEIDDIRLSVLLTTKEAQTGRSFHYSQNDQVKSIQCQSNATEGDEAQFEIQLLTGECNLSV